MANPQGIVHPEMLARLQPNHYPSLCTIQAASEAADSYGELVETWANLAGHVDLPCRIGPSTIGRSNEVRGQSQLYQVQSFTVALAGYYPAIIEKMRAVVGGQAYDIDVVRPDGQGKTMALDVRIAR